MSQQQSTVADIFRRAQGLRHEHSDWSLKQLKDALVKEFSGAPFPPLHNLTIPEQDDRAPEEDWTAGLPIVRRGIQFQNWKEVMDGILLSLEQTENYERARGPEGDRDEWHDRNVGINEAQAKGIGKWMPEELIALAERRAKK
ncbi:MAG TPA: hypothetical protein VN644_06850 [Pyrinomonadaceae bacterium]|nr:hypothetical protein [Pyrinomonadaceae bacterium]